MHIALLLFVVQWSLEPVRPLVEPPGPTAALSHVERLVRVLTSLTPHGAGDSLDVPASVQHWLHCGV
jgi:hypothetical protein